MSVRKKTLKGGSLLAGTQVVAQACSFLRNVILARFLSPSDFGVAAIFAMSLNLLDLFNMGYDKLLIQAQDGNEERFQSTIQGMLLLRGLATTALICASAGVISNLFGIPHVRWAFYFLALVPLCRGFAHLDRTRLQREMKFGIPAAIAMGNNIFILLLAWPLAYWMRDFRAMLWILIAKVVIGAAASHCVAIRPYSVSYHREYARRAFSFGWPLLINGFLIFGILQGDQFIIGSANRLFDHSFYSLADLGRYSIAFALTMAPTVIVANTTSSLFLPLFARTPPRSKEFNKRFAFCMQALALASGMIALPFILCGGVIVSGIYGAPYAGAAGLVGWLAAMQAMRILRVGPNQAALARTDAKNTMLANIIRSLALIVSLIVAARGGPLVGIAMAGFGGEVLAVIGSVIFLSKQHGVPVSLSLKPAGFVGAVIAVAIYTGAEVAYTAPALRVSLTLLLELLTFVAMVIAFPRLREGLAHSVGDLIRLTSNFRPFGFKRV